jgi:hypothetical protein
VIRQHLILFFRELFHQIVHYLQHNLNNKNLEQHQQVVINLKEIIEGNQLLQQIILNQPRMDPLGLFLFKFNLY